MAGVLKPIKAPNLPVPPTGYSQTYLSILLNVFRLYFNQVDNAIRYLVGTRGGQYINSPYGAISSTVDQEAVANNTPTVFTFNTEDFANGVVLDGTGGTTALKVAQDGIYNYQYSIQFVNTQSQAHTAWVWLRINGADAAGTGSKFDVPSTHGSSDGYVIAACNFYLSLQANDIVELVWASDRVKITSLAQDGVYVEAYPVTTSPFNHPSIPSVVATLSFVSALQA